MKRVAALLLLGCLTAIGLPAEQLPEPAAAALLSSKKALWLKAETTLPAQAGTRLHLWVGKNGDVEAVEQVCGERALFDEIVDGVLEFRFSRSNFTADLSFIRRGRRVWLVFDLPPGKRPRRVCAD